MGSGVSHNHSCRRPYSSYPVQPAVKFRLLPAKSTIMTIEFQIPENNVKEWVISDMRDAIMRMHHEHEEISRAEICFRDRSDASSNEKICEINISIFGDSIMVTGMAPSYELASRKAMQELGDTISLNVRSGSGLSEELLSTVSI